MTEILTDRDPARPPAGAPPRAAGAAPAAATVPAAARRRRPWGRYALIAAVVLIVAGLVYAWIPEPVPVETATAARTSLRVTVEEDGRTRVKDRYVVSAPVAGTLLRVTLRAGDSVAPGQTLAWIVPLAAPLLDARIRAETEARIAAAEAAVRQARTGVERAQAALTFATREAERARSLHAAGAASAQAREQAELLERTRSEELASARFGAQVAAYEVQVHRAALARLAGGGSGRMELRSPVGGVVLGVERESEGPVQAGQPVLEVGDPAALEAVVDLLTADAARIRPGAAATIDRWGGDDPLRAHVRRVEPSAFTKLSALGVEEQRVNVVLELDEPVTRRAALGDGFRIEASILLWESPDALVVPASALFRRGGGWAVFRVEEGRARLTEVTAGQRTDAQAQILDGLAPGDVVVVYPGERVVDGVRVEPTPG